MCIPPPPHRAHGSWRGGLCDSSRHQKRRQRRRGRKTGPRSQRHREARPGPQAARLCCSLGAGSSQAGPVLPRKALRRGGQPAGGQLQSQKVAVRGFHGPQPYCRGHLKTHSFPSLRVTGTVAPTFSPAHSEATRSVGARRQLAVEPAEAASPPLTRTPAAATISMPPRLLPPQPPRTACGDLSPPCLCSPGTLMLGPHLTQPGRPRPCAPPAAGHSLLAAPPHGSWRRQLSVWPVGHSQPPRAGCTRGRLVPAQNAVPDTEGVGRTGRVEAPRVRGSEEGGAQQAQAPGEARQGGRQRQPGRQEAG